MLGNQRELDVLRDAHQAALGTGRQPGELAISHSNHVSGWSVAANILDPGDLADLGHPQSYLHIRADDGLYLRPDFLAWWHDRNDTLLGPDWSCLRNEPLDPARGPRAQLVIGVICK